MATDKINKFDVDESIFHEENLPTAEQVGAIPIINAQSSAFNMDTILTSGEHYNMYKISSATLGTPYNKGKSSYSSGSILSIAVDSRNGVQTAFLTGLSNTYTRILKDGVIGEWNTGFLPLTGGKITGELKIGDHSKLGDGFFTIYHGNDTSKYSYINLLDIGLVPSLAGRLALFSTENGTTQSMYRLFGEHNKPSGSYTGNGSATERQIITGGIGTFMIVKGNSFITLVCDGVGSVAFSTVTGDVVNLGATMYCGTNLMVLKTANEVVNANGKVYDWYVL